MEKTVHAERHKNRKGIQRVEVDFIRVVFSFPTSLQTCDQTLGALTQSIAARTISLSTVV